MLVQLHEKYITVHETDEAHFYVLKPTSVSDNAESQSLLRLGNMSKGLTLLIQEATPKAIMMTMGVKGLTLYHLKSHLQKYRLGKQSGKDFFVAPNDGSQFIESPRTNNPSPTLLACNANEGYEVKDALRAQMEVQSRLHLQVEAEKHLQIRKDAEHRYMVMLERACKMLTDQIISGEITEFNNRPTNQDLGTETPENSSGGGYLGIYPLQSPDVVAARAPEEASPAVYAPHRGDCSTESCLTSREKSAPAGKKQMLNADPTRGSFIWGDSDARSLQDVKVVKTEFPRIAGYDRYGVNSLLSDGS